MKILIIAPRYHTNFIQWIQTFLKYKHSIEIAVINKSAVEDHSLLKPFLFRLSFLSKFIIKIFGNGGPNVYRGFPSIFDIRKFLNNYNPEVVIIRDLRRWFSLILFFNLIFSKSKILIYNQNPLLENISFRYKIWLFILRFFFKVKLFTTVLDNFDKKQKNLIFKKNGIYFVNFVAESNLDFILTDNKKDKNLIRILSVGKYEKRKNFLLLLSVLKEIIYETKNILKFEITIIGENTNHFHNNYKKELIKFLKKYELESYFFLKENLNYKEMKNYYIKNDFFVLPATNEPASFSVIEAISYGCPPICSTKCGTKSYISNEENGLIFKDNSFDDLKEKIYLLANNKKLLEMKNNCLSFSKIYLSSDLFYKKINSIIDEKN